MTYVVLFGVVLVLLAITVIVSVLRGGAETVEEPALDELAPAERREAALEALGRAEFDYWTGKLPEEDYRALRRRYGRAVLDAEGDVAEGELRCGRCGASADPGGRFCPRCGGPLTRESVGNTRGGEEAG